MYNFDADINDLNSIFPMGVKKPNWALTGGGAVHYLLKSKNIAHKTYPRHVYTEREHKDMDVVVFAPNKTKLILEHPHEIYWKYSADEIERCNYSLPYDRRFSVFCIEFLTHCHFGFPPPYISETVFCQDDKTKVWCVSPEYIVASKLFHYLPPREGIDDVDCYRLNAKFKFNPKTLEKIVKRSPMRFLNQEQIAQLAKNCDSVKIQQLAVEELLSRFPFLQKVDIDPKYLLGYLLLSPKILTKEKFQSTLTVTESITENWDMPAKIGLLNLIYTLNDQDQHLFLTESEELQQLFFEDSNSPIFRISFEYLALIHALKDEFLRIGHEQLFSPFAKNTAIGFLETDYLHVLISAMQFLLELSQELSELKKEHFFPLSRIINQNVTEEL